MENKAVKIQEEELNGYKWANFESAINLLSHKNYKDLLVNVVKYMDTVK